MILFIYLYNSPSLDRIIFYVAPCKRRRSFLLFALEAMLPRTFPFAICFLFIIESLFSRGRATVVWGDAREYWKLTCEDYRVDLFSQSDSEFGAEARWMMWVMFDDQRGEICLEWVKKVWKRSFVKIQFGCSKELLRMIRQSEFESQSIWYWTALEFEFFFHH